MRVSQPGDMYEREAEAIADHVMRMSDQSAGSRIQRSPEGTPANLLWTPCTACGVAQADLPSVISRGRSGGGHPLDGDTRLFMESRFGRDFGGVRIHTDGGAAESARAIGAVAYTVGNRIVFGAGHYSPQTNHGRRLLAHELTHTLQQSNSSFAPVGRVIIPVIHTGVEGIVQMTGECDGKSYRNCSGSCIPADGRGTGFCAWSGAIKTGCVCYRRDQPMLRAIQQFLFNLMIAALIAAGIVLTLAAIAAIIACLSGPCEVAALIAAVGYAGAMIVLGILGSGGGGGGSGGGASGGGPTAAAGDEGAMNESAPA
jgi:hypothetical protein